MALEVLGAVAAAGEAVLDLGEDRGAGRLRAEVVRVDVVDHDENAVDDPRNGRPLPRALAVLAVFPRAFVVRRRRREHHEAAPRLHLPVREPPVLADHPPDLAEAER
ncbi:MAG TPA: hypothetical protein VKE69_12490, partial [Planctomycetota bacterium]|nr:hypothetical protein [Planctomycetota bacterium]